MDLATKVDLLQAENDDLREKVAALEAELGRRPLLCPPEWSLTTAEARLLGAMCARSLATRDFLMAELYDGRDEAEPKIIDVYVCKMRRKLKPHRIEIITEWGKGFRLSADSRALVRARAGWGR